MAANYSINEEGEKTEKVFCLAAGQHVELRWKVSRKESKGEYHDRVAGPQMDG